MLEDFEWFATDGIGHVARFTTGGEGPIPRIVLENLSLVEDACDAATRLPRTGRPHLHVSLPRADNFEILSASGLFGYDWHDVHRANVERTNAYEKLSSPTRPLLITELGGALREAVMLIQMDHLRFSDTMSIDGVRPDWISQHDCEFP